MSVQNVCLIYRWWFGRARGTPRGRRWIAQSFLRIIVIQRRGSSPGRRELLKGLKCQRWSGSFLKVFVFFGSKLWLFPSWWGQGFAECFSVDFEDRLELRYSFVAHVQRCFQTRGLVLIQRDWSVEALYHQFDLFSQRPQDSSWSALDSHFYDLKSFITSEANWILPFSPLSCFRESSSSHQGQSDQYQAHLNYSEKCYLYQQSWVCSGVQLDEPGQQKSVKDLIWSYRRPPMRWKNTVILFLLLNLCLLQVSLGLRSSRSFLVWSPSYHNQRFRQPLCPGPSCSWVVMFMGISFLLRWGSHVPKCLWPASEA